MTLVVGIIAKDGIVISSDSRMTSSITSNDTVKKIIKLNDKNAMGVAGDGTLGIHFLELIAPDLIFEHGIVQLAEQIRELGKKKFGDYYSHLEPKDRPNLTLMIAGYTKDNKPKLYTLSSGDNFIPRPSSTGFKCIGVPYFADYLLNRFYQSEISMKQAQVLAAFCVIETESQSHDVGGDLKVATFSDKQTYTELSSDEVKNITDRCSELHTFNKNKFYPEEEPPVG